MAINWSAYDAAKELYGNNVNNIQDIGSRFPLFSRAVMAVNDENLLDILAAIPKVTARVMESGMKYAADGEEDAEVVAEEKEEKPEKKAPAKRGRKKAEPVEEEPEEDVDEEEAFDGDEVDYESMTGKALYALCCERGLSSKCKKRDKNSLIAVLKAADGENTSADDDEDWDEEEEEETDPYEGKKAKDLYLMCKKRGIKCKTGMAADAYVKLLKKADAEEAEADEEDDDDEWEV